MKNIRILLGLLLLAALASNALAADQLVKLYANGKLVNCQPAARVRAGVTYAPLRAAGDAVGAHVTWEAKSRTAVVCSNNQCVPIRASQGINVEGSLLVPVRLLGEALGAKVTWDPAAQAVRVKSRARVQ